VQVGPYPGAWPGKPMRRRTIGRHRGREEAGGGGVPLRPRAPRSSRITSNQPDGKKAAGWLNPLWAPGPHWHQDQLRQAWSLDQPLARPGAGVAYRPRGQGRITLAKIRQPARGPVHRLAKQRTSEGENRRLRRQSRRLEAHLLPADPPRGIPPVLPGLCRTAKLRPTQPDTTRHQQPDTCLAHPRAVPTCAGRAAASCSSASSRTRSDLWS
jgi:hypothetical protein